MKDINLLSQSRQQKKEGRISGIGQQLGIVFVIVLALGMISYGVLIFLKVRLAAKEAAIEQQIKAASSIVQVKKDIQSKKDKANQLSGMVDLVNAQSIINTRILDGIASVMPENVFMVNYALNQTDQLNIIGKSKDMDSIAYFIAKLKASGLFSDVYLSTVSGSTDSKDKNSPTTDYNFAALLTLGK